MSAFITVGDSAIAAARFIGMVSLEEEPVFNRWAIKILMTGGLPAVYQSFGTQAEAQAVFTGIVKSLQEYDEE